MSPVAMLSRKRSSMWKSAPLASAYRIGGLPDFSRAFESTLGATSRPHTSTPAWESGIVIRPVPRPMSSAASPTCRARSNDSPGHGRRGRQPRPGRCPAPSSPPAASVTDDWTRGGMHFRRGGWRHEACWDRSRAALSTRRTPRRDGAHPARTSTRWTLARSGSSTRWRESPWR